eukprot:6186849-Pleurochrysis_carterae.AAC.2
MLNVKRKSSSRGGAGAGQSVEARPSPLVPLPREKDHLFTSPKAHDVLMHASSSACEDDAPNASRT